MSRIRFLNKFSIALNGNDVRHYAAGQIIANPHPDILRHSEMFEEVDEVALIAQTHEENKTSIRQSITVAEEHLAALQKSLAGLEALDSLSEPVEDLTDGISDLDSPTPDGTTIKLKHKKARR